MTLSPTLSRGQVWQVRFDPSVGSEIQKIRPAVVMSEDAIGRLPLKIVVPITDWKTDYAKCVWFIHLPPSSGNGLSKDSGADAFQVKSVSNKRSVKYLSVLTPAQVEDIANAIVICVGAT